MPYLLDTSICVFFLRGRMNMDKHIRRQGRENCYLSEITVLELHYGAENSDQPVKAHQAVDAFIGGLSIIPIFGSIDRYAREKVRLRRLGRPLHDEFDLLIGVTAVEHKLTLVTDNVTDFERISDIVIENWVQRSEL